MATINTYSMIEVSDEALRNAAGEGMDDLLRCLLINTWKQRAVI